MPTQKNFNFTPRNLTKQAIRRSLKTKLTLIGAENKILVDTINGYVQKVSTQFEFSFLGGESLCVCVCSIYPWGPLQLLGPMQNGLPGSSLGRDRPKHNIKIRTLY